jgi:ferrous iron transport protein A
MKDMKIGDRAKVKRLELSGAIRRRLRDIGLIEGTNVECTLKSPSGDPAAYLIRGAIIAIRSEDSGRVLIER